MYSDDDDSQERIVLPLVIGVAAFVIVGLLGVVGLTRMKAKTAEKPAISAPVTATPAANAAASAAATAVVLKDDESKVVVENGVVKFYFASGKADLAKGANEALVDVVKGIKAGQKATISGFHDTTGNAAANAELSKKRAFAVRDALVALGVSADLLELKKPDEMQGTGSNAEARRVEVTLVK